MGLRRVRQVLLANFLLMACHPKNATSKVLVGSPSGATVLSTTGDAGDRSSDSGAVVTGALPMDAHTFALVPVLDKKRGQSAAEAYGHFLTTFCAPSGTASNESVGLSPDADICAGGLVEAIASGSFFEVRADEVLLNVPSGEAAAMGDVTLALMRATKEHGYRLIRHVLLSKGFTAPARIAVQEQRDILMLCGQWGNMGLYPSDCGFLGQGTFRADSEKEDAGVNIAEAASELSLVDVTDCGHQTTVYLGDIALSENRLSVGLVVDEEMRQEKGPKDPERDFCGKTTTLKKKQFTMTYLLGLAARDARESKDARARLLTPIPSEVEAALDSHEN